MANHDDQNRQQDDYKRKIILLILLIILALAIIFLLLWQGLRQPDLSKNQESPVLTQVTGTLKNGKELYLETGGGDISVLISACRINLKGKIVLTPMGAYVNEQANADTSWSYPRTADVSFYDSSNKLIDNLELVCPIQVCFKLTDDQWNRYSKVPTDFAVQYLDDKDTTKPLWIPIKNQMFTDTHKLCGENYQLGLYGLAVKNLPSPETGNLYSPEEIELTPTQSLYEP